MQASRYCFSNDLSTVPRQVARGVANVSLTENCSEVYHSDKFSTAVLRVSGLLSITATQPVTYVRCQ